MKRLLILIIHIALLLAFVGADETTWEWDAEKADSFFAAGDYDAAWLFYERALIGGVDDGLLVYRAAESFDRQQMVENPEFGTALYAVAHYFIQNQYPDNPALAAAESRMDPETVVTRGFLRKTYGVIGAKVPRARRTIRDGLAATVKGFVGSSLDDLLAFTTILRTDGLREGFAWARGHLLSILLAILMVNALTGIILPVVMALTVAKEGRKSYVTAYLFLIHWGPLGIHRFYLGRYVSAVIWLFTGGLLGLGVFFDIFLTGAYVRFWNEDHRDERPALALRSTGRTNPRVVKPPKPKAQPKAKKAPKPVKAKKVKAKKVKAKKVKPPKPPRAPKEKKSRNPESAASGISAASGAAMAGLAMGSQPESDAEGFSFDEPSVSEASVADDTDFGDLPDLDLGGDDFDIPSIEAGDEVISDFSGELSDDEFDLGSLE